MTRQKYDLFVSYADADRDWVEGYLFDILNQVSVRYHHEAAFALGTVRLLEFERAIQQSDRILLVLSPAYLADGFNQFIDLLAQCYGFESKTWPVIPLILQSVKLPPRLDALVELNATNPDEWEEATRRLCAELKRPVPAPLPKPRCPYPGMIPFSVDDSDRFFGRDQEVEELLEYLRLHPFRTVIGPSGSGKSSLVFAGLIPALRRSGRFGSGDWLVRTMRPGETPIANLRITLGSDLADPALAVTEALAAQTHTQRLLLVVDQFEEVFTLAGQEAVPFQQALLRLTETPNCYLILTVRADFYSELMGSPLWRKIKSHRLEVVPLDEAGLREAIIRPAEDVGVFVEPALLERLVVDAAGEPGFLPLIQETLVLLWEKVERRFLPLRAYEALVLPRKAYGALGNNKQMGLQVAIARRANAAIADLSEEQQAISRRIFLRLVQFGEGRADTRRQQPVDALRAAGDNPHLFDQTLRHLEDKRLLTLNIDKQDSSRKADIAHEALISGWPTLRQWLTERREAEQTRRRLEAQAQEWVRLGSGSGGLLDNIKLAEAERWLSTSDATDLGYDESLAALVTASREAIEQLERDKQKRQRRELQLARTRTKLAIAAAGFASVALFTVGFAFLQQRQSQKTIEAVFLGSDTTEILKALPELHEKADKYRNSVDRFKDPEDLEGAIAYYQTHKTELNRAFAYYRNILTETGQLRSLAPESTSTQLEEIGNEAENSLAELLDKYRLPQLKLELNQQPKPNFGKLLSETQRTDFEEQYSEGALRTTYEILMRDSGAGADLNNDGYIADKIEANQMPCEILREIERLWRKATHERCGWYGEEGQYEDADCHTLDPDRNTLYVSIFEYSTGDFDPIMRIEACGITPKIRSTGN